jgi:hypothetical protein
MGETMFSHILKFLIRRLGQDDLIGSISYSACHLISNMPKRDGSNCGGFAIAINLNNRPYRLVVAPTETFDELIVAINDMKNDEDKDAVQERVLH